jgi:lipopolysaccharide biosynthesis glycosyltransferase
MNWPLAVPLGARRRSVTATALCLTPDLSFFPPAVRTAASILSQTDSAAFDLFIVCEERDVPREFAALDPALRARINLLVADFSRLHRGADAPGRFSRAVFRRLFLDRVLPERYERILSVDSDMLIARPGLGALAAIDLRGFPLAAAYDMIFMMDQRGDALSRRFQRYRRSLGLDVATPYFNAGLMAIDRRRWRDERFGERVIEALLDHPQRYPFLEQSALNSLIRGGFAPLSPRYNFMGEFLLLDVEKIIEPIVLHFVNAPKPWNFGRWRGEARFAEAYRSFFAASPWPLLGEAGGGQSWRVPRKTAGRSAFAERLLTFLDKVPFVDRPTSEPKWSAAASDRATNR